MTNMKCLGIFRGTVFLQTLQFAKNSEVEVWGRMRLAWKDQARSLSFLSLVSAYNAVFRVTVPSWHWNIHNAEIWGQDEMLFWSGDESSHSFSDKTHPQSRAPWLSVRQMGSPDAYQATVLQQRKQKPRCRMYWNSADGPSRVFAVYKNRNGLSSLSDRSSWGSVSPSWSQAAYSPHPPTKARQQLSMTSGPSKGESGWLLSPCQDVLIMWTLRVRDSTLAWFFYSPSASHTSFSCLQSF